MHLHMHVCICVFINAIYILINIYTNNIYGHISINTYICIESESEIGSCVLSHTWQQKKRTIARTRLKQEQNKQERKRTRA